MIEYRGIDFAHPGRTPILRNLAFELESGLTHALIGPSGCGKTTLLYLAAGLHAPSAGKVFVGGEPVNPGRRNTAVILQDHGLFPWKTVRANLELGLSLRGVRRDERKGLADRALRETGISGHDSKYPKQLSGGERQRLAIARALVLSPDLLLLDEPFSSLDAMTRERLQNRLAELARARNGEAIRKAGTPVRAPRQPLTILLVTHDIAEAAFLADRIHVMGSTDKPDRDRIVSLDNPLEAADRRTSPLFYETCARVRALLAEATR